MTKAAPIGGRIDIVCVAVLLFALVLFLPRPLLAESNAPGFLLHFIFNPPYTPIGSMPTPAIDVCGDNFCNNVQAIIQPRCLARSDAPGALISFQECVATAMLTERGPDINMALLSHPVMLRFRMDNAISAPFQFGGGRFSYPLSEYIFAIGHSGTVLSVIPY